MADNDVIATVPADNIKEATTNIDANTDAMRRNKEVADTQADSIARLNDNYKSISGTLSNNRAQEAYSASLQRTTASMNGQIDVSQRLVNGLSLATTAALGAGEALAKASAGANTSGLNTFKDQWSSLRDLLIKSPAGEVVQKSLGGIVEGFGKLGLPAAAAKAALGGTMDALIKFGDNLVEGASQAQTFRAATIQNAQASGDWGNILRQTNPDLSNLNDLLFRNANVLNQSSIELGKSPEQLGQYYAALAKIPGALNAQVSGLTDASVKTTGLTAAYNLATGSGQSFETIISDLSEAYNRYGVEGEKALKISARFSEVSTNLGVPLDLVKSSLQETAKNFDHVANAGDSAEKQFHGLAEITNRYFESLKSQGMTTGQSLATITTMTSAVEKLNTAQRAFVSQQTGGPGGLMGSFQIEKMLREGQSAQVFDKVRETLMKQLGGNIVSLDQASNSEQAAQQYQRQRSLVTQGPLAGFVNNERDADRLLNALKNNNPRDFKPLESNSLQTQMQRGDAIEGSTRTIASDFAAQLGRQTLNANITNLGVLERALAQNPLSSVAGMENVAARQMRQNMAQRQTGTAPTNVYGDLKGLQNFVGGLPTAFKAAAGGFIDAVKNGNSDEAEKQKSQLENEIKNSRARNDVTSETRNKEMFLNSLNAYENKNNVITNVPRMLPNQQNNKNSNDFINSNKFDNREPQRVIVESQIKGICIECGRKSEENSQARMVSPQAFKENR